MFGNHKCVNKDHLSTILMSNLIMLKVSKHFQFILKLYYFSNSLNIFLKIFKTKINYILAHPMDHVAIN